MFIRKRLTYANVAATLALVFSMSGGALAASHFIITSPKQISPKVIKKLKGKRGPVGKTGATGKEGPAGKEGLPGKEGPPGKEGKEGAPATTLWARVGHEGTLKKGSGVVSTKEITTGGYEVVFNRSVTACAYSGTIGSADISNTEFDIPTAGQIDVEPRFATPDAVWVETTSSAGGEQEDPFSVVVFC